MSDQELHRDMGRLESRVDALLHWRDEMREWCKGQDTKLDAIVATANQAKGGLRAMAVVGSVGGAVGGFLVSLWHMFRGV